jgi:uncharacterized protein
MTTKNNRAQKPNRKDAADDSSHNYSSNFNDIAVLDTAQINLDSNGFWHTKARFAGPGIYEYNPSELPAHLIVGITGRKIRVLRPKSVVHDSAYMSTFEHVPITHEHESGLVDGDNAAGVVRGTTKAPVAVDDDGRLVVDAVVYDKSIIQRAQSGECKELSAGYVGQFARQGGTDPEYGDYDIVMTGGRGNHVTVTSRGKAGEAYYIGDKIMTVKRKIDGIDYECDEQTAQVLDRALAERDGVKEDLKAASDKLAETESKLADAEKKLAEAVVTDSDIDARIEARQAVLDSARKINKDAALKDADGNTVSTKQLVLDAVKVRYPKVDLEGKSDDYVQALFDRALEDAEADTGDGKSKNGNNALPAGVLDSSAPVIPGYVGGVAAAARAKFIAERSGRRS